MTRSRYSLTARLMLPPLPARGSRRRTWSTFRRPGEHRRVLPEHALHHHRQRRPLAAVLRLGPPAARREAVVLAPPAVVPLAPRAGDEALVLEAVQHRVHGA